MKKESSPPAEENSVPLNEEELQLLRSREDELGDRSQIPPPDNKKQNKIIKFAKSNKLLAVIISVLTLSFIAVAVLLCIYLAANSGFNSKKDYVFTYGEEEVREKYEVIVNNGTLYVDMDKLAKFAEISRSGSSETRKYVVSDEEYLKFTDGYDYAVVNGAKVVLEPPAIVTSERCLVPYQFVSKAIESGLSFSHDQKKHTVKIEKVTHTENEEEIAEPVSFTAERFTVVKAIQTTIGVDFAYGRDVTNYLQYIEPADPSPYLILVNSRAPLDENYIPLELAKIPSSFTASGTYELLPCAKEALTLMMLDMYAVYPNAAYVTSAYRSYTYQNNLFEGYVKKYTDAGMSREEAVAEVLKTSARPGTSEHQTGLCVDFFTDSLKNGLVSEDFEKTRAFEWLSSNAHKYGFILRYPKDKQDFVSHEYESWHFRFVGRTAATEMYVSNLCLEEYLELI